MQKNLIKKIHDTLPLMYMHYYVLNRLIEISAILNLHMYSIHTAPGF